MTVIKWLVAQYKAHGTKYIGAAAGIVSALSGVAGLISPAHLPYWMGAAAVLTFLRGFENTANKA